MEQITPQDIAGRSRFYAVVMGISRTMAAAGAVALAAMMFVTVTDVSGRAFFLKPLEGGFELVGILLVIAGTWGMGYCQLLKGNIRISIIFDMFPRRGQAALDIFTYVIALVSLFLMFWQGILRMYVYMFKQFGAVTETLSMPFWPFMLMMVIGFGWVLFIMLIDCYNSIVEVAKR